MTMTIRKVRCEIYEVSQKDFADMIGFEVETLHNVEIFETNNFIIPDYLPIKKTKLKNDYYAIKKEVKALLNCGDWLFDESYYDDSYYEMLHLTKMLDRYYQGYKD